jgi:hypothetical protein
LHVLGTYYHDLETTENHIRILRKTPLVEDVVIVGYNARLLSHYRVALAALRLLRTLKITRYCRADRKTDSFMENQGALLAMIKRYPKLEQIEIPLECESQIVQKYCEGRSIQFTSK